MTGARGRLIDSPAFSGDGNQTIFALDVADAAVIAGGGDGALVHRDLCCFYPDGLAFWRSVDHGDRWERTPVAGPPYGEFALGAVVGFLRPSGELEADVSANPPRRATSVDRGASWSVTEHPDTSERGVTFPRASSILQVDPNRFVATHGAVGVLRRLHDGRARVQH